MESVFDSGSSVPAGFTYDANKSYFFLQPAVTPQGGKDTVSYQIFMVDADDFTDKSAWLELPETLVDGAGRSVSACVGRKYYTIDMGARTAQVYDPATDVLSLLAQVPANPFGFWACAAVGTDIYIKGSYGSAAKKFFRYDTVNDTWTTLQDTIFSAGNGVSLAYDGSGRLYCAQGGNSPTIHTYDTAGQVWLNVTLTAPGNINYCSGIGYDGETLYVRGYTKTLFMYKTTTQQWTTGPQSPGYYFTNTCSPLHIHSGRLYVAGADNNFDVYDIVANTWTTEDVDVFKVGKMIGYMP